MNSFSFKGFDCSSIDSIVTSKLIIMDDIEK